MADNFVSSNIFCIKDFISANKKIIFFSWIFLILNLKS